MTADVLPVPTATPRRRWHDARGWRIAIEFGGKVLSIIPVVIAVSVLTFVLMSLIPGDPTTALLPNTATEEVREALRRELGLDRPLIVQYLDWAGGALTGDLGISYRSRIPVAESIAQRMPVTVELLVLSQLLALAVAIPVAVVSADRRGGRFDRAATAIAFGVISLPNFVLALLLGYVFALQLGWLPSSGFVPLQQNIIGNLRSVLLPTITLAAGAAAVYVRLLRAEMISTLDQDFILVAKAKGVPRRRILYGHALRPSSFPLITAVGLTMGSLMGGALVIEVIFGLPGIGSLLYSAITNRDYMVVQGVVLVIAVSYAVINLLIDLLYGILDPRVRRG